MLPSGEDESLINVMRVGERSPRFWAGLGNSDNIAFVWKLERVRGVGLHSSVSWLDFRVTVSTHPPSLPTPNNGQCHSRLGIWRRHCMVYGWSLFPIRVLGLARDLAKEVPRKSRGHVGTAFWAQSEPWCYSPRGLRRSGSSADIGVSLTGWECCRHCGGVRAHRGR